MKKPLILVGVLFLIIAVLSTLLWWLFIPLAIGGVVWFVVRRRKGTPIVRRDKVIAGTALTLFLLGGCGAVVANTDTPPASTVTPVAQPTQPNASEARSDIAECETRGKASAKYLLKEITDAQIIKDCDDEGVFSISPNEVDFGITAAVFNECVKRGKASQEFKLDKTLDVQDRCSWGDKADYDFGASVQDYDACVKASKKYKVEKFDYESTCKDEPKYKWSKKDSPAPEPPIKKKKTTTKKRTSVNTGPGSCGPGRHWVRPHTRSNGQNVRGHCRSN